MSGGEYFPYPRVLRIEIFFEYKPVDCIDRIDAWLRMTCIHFNQICIMGSGHESLWKCRKDLKQAEYFYLASTLAIPAVMASHYRLYVAGSWTTKNCLTMSKIKNCGSSVHNQFIFIPVLLSSLEYLVSADSIQLLLGLSCRPKFLILYMKYQEPP